MSDFWVPQNPSKSTESAGRVGQQKGSVRGIILKSGNLEIWNLRMCVCVLASGFLRGEEVPPVGSSGGGIGPGPSSRYCRGSVLTHTHILKI